MATHWNVFSNVVAVPSTITTLSLYGLNWNQLLVVEKYLYSNNKWPKSMFCVLRLTRKPQEAKESQRFHAGLPHEDQLHVRQDEAVGGQRDLRHDYLPVAEGRIRFWHGYSFLLCRTWTSQWAGAYRMGKQPHGAANRRQGKSNAMKSNVQHQQPEKVEASLKLLQMKLLRSHIAPLCVVVLVGTENI